MVTATVRDHATLAALSGDWAELHTRARPGTPFEHPAWLGAWARHFVPEGDLHVITVREDGRLVAVRRSTAAVGTCPAVHARCSRWARVTTSTDRGGPGPRGAGCWAGGPPRCRAAVEGVPGWDWLHLSWGRSRAGWCPSGSGVRRRPRSCTGSRGRASSCGPCPWRRLPVDTAPAQRAGVRSAARNRTARFGGMDLLTLI
jgi:hypothetical protein